MIPLLEDSVLLEVVAEEVPSEASVVDSMSFSLGEVVALLSISVSVEPSEVADELGKVSPVEVSE